MKPTRAGTVDGWEALEDTLTLPDPDDRHVVAAAVGGRADAIVTANTRDYPSEVLGRLNIEVVHPHAFWLDQLDLASASSWRFPSSRPRIPDDRRSLRLI